MCSGKIHDQMGDPERGRPPGARRSSLTRQPPQRTGTWSKRRPRRDCVSPFEPEGSPVDGEHGIPDNPNGPTPNGVEQICIPCPKLRGSNPPPAAFGGHPRQRGTQDGARIHLRQRGTEEAGRIHPRPRTGTCSKRRPRRDYVSPFEPEGSHRGLPLHGEANG